MSKYRIRSRSDKKNNKHKFRKQHQRALWQSDIEKGRQTDRPSDRPDRPDRRTGRHTNAHADTQANNHTGRKKGRREIPE